MPPDNLLSLRDSLVGGLYRLRYVGEKPKLGIEDRIYTSWRKGRAFLEGAEQPPRLDYGQIVLVSKKSFSATQVVVGEKVLWIDHFKWIACEEVTDFDE